MPLWDDLRELLLQNIDLAISYMDDSWSDIMETEVMVEVITQLLIYWY